jgi:two-component system sensor histidine kinase KdpD
VPRRVVEYRETQLLELDVDAVKRRKPQVVCIDELAHTNAPGSRHHKRWEDVQEILDAGIDVWATLNVQHLESLNDQVWDVTGIRVRETVPDWVVDAADEVVFVDLTPRALRNRLERGVVYAPEKAQKAMENFFIESNLTALREMAMRHAAHELEDKLEAPPAGQSPVLETERILICLTGRPSSAMLIRRARRVADYLQAGCLALHVSRGQSMDETVQRHMSFARNLRIETHIVEGESVARAIAEFARKERVTQIFMGRSAPLPWWKRMQETTVQQLVRQARDMQITIVAERRR